MTELTVRPALSRAGDAGKGLVDKNALGKRLGKVPAGEKRLVIRCGDFPPIR
jgi:hypothetical protein